LVTHGKSKAASFRVFLLSVTIGAAVIVAACQGNDVTRPAGSEISFGISSPCDTISGTNFSSGHANAICEAIMGIAQDCMYMADELLSFLDNANGLSMEPRGAAWFAMQPPFYNGNAPGAYDPSNDKMYINIDSDDFPLFLIITLRHEWKHHEDGTATEDEAEEFANGQYCYQFGQ
jgi:hypothetical protein